MASTKSYAVQRFADGTQKTLPTSVAPLKAALGGEENSIVWIDLTISDPADAWPLSDVFGFHPLTIEDVVSPRIDPAKVDDHGEYLFIIAQFLSPYREDEPLKAAEVSFYVGRNYVVSCHQVEVPPIDEYRKRLERGEHLPSNEATWLLHGMLDTLVDSYLPIVDALDDSLDEIQERVLEREESNVLERIMTAKRNALRLRRATVPGRDIMSRLSRNEFPHLIREDAAIYFRDIYDHLVRTEYLVESLRDLADGALQTYLSAVSNRLNEVMKVLTAAATIFLPLTVITGIYGMNFNENVFPGFHESWGFPAVAGAMLLISLLMLAYFRRRGWV